MERKTQQDIRIENNILEMRKNGSTGSEIAKQLHMDQRKVFKIIDELINKGLLSQEDKNLKKKVNMQRKQKALDLIHEGKTVKQIAEEVGVSLETVYVYISEFIEKEIVTKEELRKNSDMDLENRVLELRMEGHTKRQIMKELGLGQSSIIQIIQKLVDDGKLIGTKLSDTEYTSEGKLQRKNEILNFLRSGYSVQEIGKILRISDSSVYSEVKELIGEGKIDEEEILLKKQMRLGDLEQNIINMLENGNNRQQISNTLQLSYNEINPIINRLITEGRLNPVTKKRRYNPTRIEMNKTLGTVIGSNVTRRENDSNDGIVKAENFDSVTIRRIVADCRSKMKACEEKIKDGEINGVVRRQYANCCQQLVECGEKLTKDEVEALAETVAYGEGKFNLKVLAFVCNEYGKLGEYKNAQRLCTICTDLYGESEILSKIKTMIKEARSKQVAYEMIKQGKPDIVIMNASGLRQVDVIRIRREYANGVVLNTDFADIDM